MKAFWRALSGIFLVAALSACARPSVEIESSELEASNLGFKSVGLLEVHRANSGRAFGMSIGESLNESSYCTVALVEENLVVTGADCLQNKDGKFETEDMEVHLKQPGASTISYPVEAIERVDALKRMAYLSIRSKPSAEQVAAALSFHSTPLTTEEQESNLETLTVTVPAPNKDGLSRIVVSSTILHSAEKPKAASQPEEEAALLEPVAAGGPRPVAVSGLKDGTRGAPIFYKGNVIGIIQEKGADKKEAVFFGSP